MHEPKGVHCTTEGVIASSERITLKHLVPGKCLINVLFLLTDFQPSKCVETYTEGCLPAALRDHFVLGISIYTYPQFHPLPKVYYITDIVTVSENRTAWRA